MNTAQLSALFQQHKIPILAGAGGVVVLLGLRARKAGATSASSSTPTTASSSGTPVTYGPPQAFTGAAYDSSTSDVYNALEQQWEQWKSTQSPTPVPAVVTPTSNTDWINQAVKGWTDAGNNPIDLQAALTQYVQGQPINTAQESGIGWAIKNYGTAPQGTQGTSPIVKA